MKPLVIFKAYQNIRIISNAFTFAVISVTEKQQLETGFDENQAPFMNKELRKKVNNRSRLRKISVNI